MENTLSTLKVFSVGSAINSGFGEALFEPIREAFDGVIRRLRFLDYESPALDSIEAGLLTQVLDLEVGGHVLGITDAELVDDSGTDFFRFMFGGKDRRNHVAVVSTRRISMYDPQRVAARLLKISLHELGHNFGLVHHYSFVSVDQGGCCPMSKGDFNRHGERGYLRSVIDARGLHFCDSCRAFMRKVHATSPPGG